MGTDENETKSSVKPFLAGAIIGGIAGAAVALLLAPSEGSEIRRGIGGRFDQLLELVNKFVANAKQTAEDGINEGRVEGARLVGEARDRAESLIREADVRINAARDALRTVREAVNREEMEDEDPASEA